MPGMPVLATQRRPYAPSPDTMRLALNAARAGIWEWHLDTNHNDWSDELWSLYGLPRDVPPGFDGWLASIHPDDQARICQLAVQASRQLTAFEIEWRTHPDNGPVRWLLSRGTPAPTAKGSDRYVGIVVDITEHKLAQQAVLDMNATLEQRAQERTETVQEHERLLQTILDGMPGMVGYWTRELRNRFANKAYRDWLGKSPEELRDRHISETLGDEVYAQNRAQIEAALRGVPQHFERRFPVPDRPGEHRFGEVHYVPDVRLGEVRGFLVMVFDTSLARKAELVAEAANEAKSDFLASISHEVRTPLNAMFGLAQLGARQTTGSAAQRTFEQILDAAQHLLALVNDMLDFSKIEAGKLTLHQERVNLAQVLEHVLSLKAMSAQAKGLQLHVIEGPNVPQFCVGDGTRLSQILLNLLSNAIQYTDMGEVVLRVDVQDQQLCLDVTDTGIGMTAEQIDKLFKPFVQVHGKTAGRTGGFGLGLAITQRLVHLMKGEITVRAAPGQGSQFSVRLPLGGSEPPDFRHLHSVQLVDLEADERECLQLALQQRGCEVHCTHGIELPGQASPQLMVLGPVATRLTDSQQLRLLVDAGVKLLLSSPTGATVDLPDCLHEDMLLTGPLTPLRLLNAVDRHQHPQPQAAALRLQRTRVLAAEDNPVNRMVLGQMLEQEGATVTFANDGAEAIEIIRQQGAAQFDIVLCDIQMPVMDGYEATRVIRTIAPELPVVGLTAHAFASAKQQARDAGMVDYVTKPYLLDTLVQVVRRHVKAPQRVHPPQSVTSSPSQPSLASFSPLPRTPDLSGQAATPVGSDFQHMQQHFRSQPLLLERLLGMLHRTLTEVDRDLASSLSTRNFDALAKVAHNIKGTALNLHAPEMTRFAMQTQDEARRRGDQAWPAAEALQASLRQFIAEANAQSSGGN